MSVPAAAAPTHVALGHCPACGSRSRTCLLRSHDWVHNVPGSFPLMRCDDCRSLYPDPRPAPEALAAYYPEGEYYAYAPHPRHELWGTGGPLARLWYATKRGALRRRGYTELGGSALLGATLGRLPGLRDRATFSLGVLLHPWAPDGALLDVGCGNGRYLDLMRALGWTRVAGVDTSETAIREARDGLGLEAYHGDLRNVGLAAGAFDAVSMAHTLEHVDDPPAVLSEVRRVMRPGGRLAIVVPNASSLLARVLGEHWLHLDTPRHLSIFSPAGLRHALERAGLKVERLTTRARNAYVVALLSLSRAAGDPSDVHVNPEYPFGPVRRVAAGALAGSEWALCTLRVPLGEEIWALASP